MAETSARIRFVREIIRPVVIAAVLLVLVVSALIIWSTNHSDRLEINRQRALLASVIDQSSAAIAHDQEASTVWNEAVVELRKRPLDVDWLDDNMGVWMFEYYGHDRIYIVDSHNEPVYAMIDGARAEPSRYVSLAPVVAPMLARLHREMLEPLKQDGEIRMMTHGVSDLATVDGRPSIISVKPVSPEQGTTNLGSGGEYMHVAIRYLDGSFANRLARRFWLQDGRFTTSPERGKDEEHVAIHTRSGETIGYFLWRPFRPGRIVLSETAPTLLAALFVLVVGVALLLRKLYRSMLELHQSQSKAEYQAYHDALTGLPNRAQFETRLDQMLSSLSPEGPSLALLFLDLDRFKMINDTQGHAAGDMLIAQVGERLLKVIRENDMVARLGGDEFAVVLRRVRGHGDIEQTCARIIRAICSPFDLGGTAANIGVSIGVAAAPDDGRDRAELSRKADIALYRAKSGGRARYVRFSSEMDDHIRVRQAIEHDLRAALDGRGKLEMHYQPIIAAETGTIEGVEALLRWSRSGYGPIPPNQFIAIAEESGLIEPLGEWVLRQVCTEAARWPLGTISINISPLQLRMPGFAERMLDIIDECEFDPARLEFEITETCLIDDAAECQPNISALRARGVGIALDDFGTGYSSFNHFRQIKVDRLKIDRSFVAAIDPENPESPIVKAIVDLASSAGIGVTAEGVETLEQSAYLTRIGCDSLQGWYHGKPMPAVDITELLRPPLKLVKTA